MIRRLCRILWPVILTLTPAVCGQTLNSPQSAFLGGELSPLVMHRLQSAPYQSGCRTLENAIIAGPGVAMRRPGTIYVTGTQANRAARLEPFVYSEDDAYALEWTAGKLRFFRAGGIVLDDAGDAYEVNTPYTADECFEFQTYQTGDYMYITHGSHMPQLLTRTDHDDWTLDDVNVTTGPFLLMNMEEIYIEANDVNETVTLIADSNVWDSDHVGALWGIEHVMPTQADTGTCDAVEDNNEVVCGVGATYAWSFQSTAFFGTIALQVSYDEGETWRPVYVATNGASDTMDVNETDVADFGQNVLMRVACTDFTSGDVDFDLEIESYVHLGIVRIASYVDANEVTATVLDRIGQADVETERWYEGAWSDYRGYPECVTSHFGRIIYAKDLWLWWSSVEDRQRFYPGTADNDAFSYLLGVSRQNPIRWMIGERTQNLTVGTLGNVLELRSLDELSGFTPTNPPKVSSASSVPCAAITPILADTAILFVDRTARRIHEMVYDQSQQSVVSPDMTKLADHVTTSGVRQIAMQKSPEPILWACRNDGVVATMTYSQTFSIAAWSRFVTDGQVQSVTAIPAGEKLSDRVWLCVYRDPNYYIEYVDDPNVYADVNDAVYLDSSLSWSGGDAVDISAITNASPAAITLDSWPTGLSDGDNVRIEDVSGMTEINERTFVADDCNEADLTLTLDTISGSDFNSVSFTAYSSGGTLQIVENSFGGLSHLAGQEVQIMAAGAYYGTDTVSGAGSVTLDDYYASVCIGLAYTTTIEPIEINFSFEWGSAFTALKRIVGTGVSLYRSCGGQYGPSTSVLRDIPYDNYADEQVLSPYTGTMILPPFGGFMETASVVFVQSYPMPFVLRSVFPMFEVNP